MRNHGYQAVRMEVQASTQEPEQSTEMSGQVQGQGEDWWREQGFLTLCLLGRLTHLTTQPRPAQDERTD